MMIRAMTVVIYFNEGEEPEKVTLSGSALGGQITAMASYDMMHTMEIAEEALNESDDSCCIQARREIDKFICGQQ